MNRQPGRRSSLFLLELMIAIFFFILASAICILLFVTAHTLENDSLNLNQAVHACTSAAEILRSQEEPLSLFSELYPDGALEKDGFCAYFNDSWQPCTVSDSVFVMHLQFSDKEHLRSGEIVVSSPEDTLYSLHVEKHLAKEVLP